MSNIRNSGAPEDSVTLIAEPLFQPRTIFSLKPMRNYWAAPRDEPVNARLMVPVFDRSSTYTIIDLDAPRNEVYDQIHRIVPLQWYPGVSEPAENAELF